MIEMFKKCLKMCSYRALEKPKYIYTRFNVNIVSVIIFLSQVMLKVVFSIIAAK